VSQLALWIVPKEPEIVVPVAVIEPGRGIDLNDPEDRGLVERIYWSRWASQVRAGGLDADDVLQKVYLGLLARNRGINPYNPLTSSRSNYVFIVIKSVVRNAVDAHKRAKARGWVVGEGEDAALTASTDERCLLGGCIAVR
jgi:hypothetical protein